MGFQVTFCSADAENFDDDNSIRCPFVQRFNITKYILTFVDSINCQFVAGSKIKKHVLKHKNICTTVKTVVILQPQSGRKRNERRENIDNNATGQTETQI